MGLGTSSSLTFRSNAKHVDEIKAKGWELPAVNQIEVRNYLNRSLASPVLS